jgi:hypothetical protein
MGGDQVVTRERGPPIALAARDKYDLALFVGKPIERSLDGEIGAPLALASARVRKHVGPPFFVGGLLRVRPGTVLDGITRLNHGAAISLATSGRLTSSRTKFGGMKWSSRTRRRRPVKAAIAAPIALLPYLFFE